MVKPIRRSAAFFTPEHFRTGNSKELLDYFDPAGEGWKPKKYTREQINAIAGALQHTDDEVRSFAALELSHIGKRAANHALEISDHTLGPRNRNRDWEVRHAGLIALGNMGKPVLSRYVLHFVHALNDPKRDIRETAGEVLQSMGKDSVKHLVIELPHDDPDMRYRIAKHLKDSGLLRKGDAIHYLLDNIIKNWESLDNVGFWDS